MGVHRGPLPATRFPTARGPRAQKINTHVIFGPYNSGGPYFAREEGGPGNIENTGSKPLYVTFEVEGRIYVIWWLHETGYPA